METILYTVFTKCPTFSLYEAAYISNSFLYKLYCPIKAKRSNYIFGQNLVKT